jgi:hypothetical protein
MRRLLVPRHPALNRPHANADLIEKGYSSVRAIA